MANIHRATDWDAYNRQRSALWPGRREAKETRDREREESRQRATRFQNRFKRQREEDAAKAEAEVTQRVKEAQATILETEAKKAEDQNWVTKFTPQQDQEIAELETAVQKVKSGVISGDIGLEDGGRMVRAINQRIGSYQPIRRRRRDDEPWYEKGKAPGNIFEENDTTYVVQPDGTPKLTIRPDQTLKAQREKIQLALEEKQRLAEEKRALEVEKYMRDLRTEQIEMKITDAKGDEHIEKRYRTSAEVYEATLRGYPELAGPQFGAMPQQVTQAGGGGPITDAEFQKLPEGASYRHADGTIRQKRSQEGSRKASRSANHFPSLVGF